MSLPILRSARAEIIRMAFVLWYDGLTDKLKILAEIGRNTKETNNWKKGIRPIPLAVLAALYERTGKSEFLLTEREKRLYQQRNPSLVIPPEERWPHLAEVEGEVLEPTVSVDELRCDLQGFIEQIRGFATIPSKDPRRERARRELVGPTMEIFRELTHLGLEYPKEFTDLLDQLGFITRAFTTHR